MKILLQFGLSNRIRTIVGFIMVSKLTGIPVKFHWIPDAACNGKWSDVFAPIACLEEREERDEKYDFIGQNIVQRIVAEFVPPEKTPSKEEMRRMELEEYSKFRITAAILNRVRRLLPWSGFYAMHVRRGDHVSLAKSVGKFTPLSDFEKFADAAKENQCSLYLATDCRDVQKHFKGAFHNRELGNTNNLRPTSLADAMVDVLMCSLAVEFKGTGYSSFSGLIDVYRCLDVRNML